VVDSKVPSAHYRLTDPVSQIRSYVFDVIRSSLPRMELDDAFASKSDLAEAVRNQLQHLMADYGYEIMAALVVDLNPDRNVKAAMNEINGTLLRRDMTCHSPDT
jgi:regulator of protease activity HflC (stomatin/prohibitin superfamily)